MPETIRGVFNLILSPNPLGKSVGDDDYAGPISSPRYAGAQVYQKLEVDAYTLAEDILDHATPHYGSISGSVTGARLWHQFENNADIILVSDQDRAGKSDQTIRFEVSHWHGSTPGTASIRQFRGTDTTHDVGRAWKLFDIDRAKYGGKVFQSPLEARGGLLAVYPDLRDVPMVIKASTSSYLYRDGVQVKGPGGWHVWVLLQEGSEFKEILDRMHLMAINRGVCWPHIDKTGRLTIRTPFDRELAKPAQPIYIGGAVIPPRRAAEGWSQDRPTAEVFSANGSPLSLRDIPEAGPSLESEQIERYRRDPDLAKAMSERQEGRQRFIHEHGLIAYTDNDLRLHPDHILYFDSGLTATVREVALKPNLYTRKVAGYLRDPTDEKRRQGKAFIMFLDGGVAVRSYLDSGVIYWITDGNHLRELQSRLHLTAIDHSRLTFDPDLQDDDQEEIALHAAMEADQYPDMPELSDGFELYAPDDPDYFESEPLTREMVEAIRGGELVGRLFRDKERATKKENFERKGKLFKERSTDGLALDLFLSGWQYQGIKNNYVSVETSPPGVPIVDTDFIGTIQIRKAGSSMNKQLVSGPQNSIAVCNHLNYPDLWAAARDVGQTLQTFVYSAESMAAFQRLGDHMGIPVQQVHGRTSKLADGSYLCPRHVSVTNLRRLGPTQVYGQLCSSSEGICPVKALGVCPWINQFILKRGLAEKTFWLFHARWANIPKNGLIEVSPTPAVSVVATPISQMMEANRQIFRADAMQKVIGHEPDLIGIVKKRVRGEQLTTGEMQYLDDLKQRPLGLQIFPAMGDAELEAVTSDYVKSFGAHVGEIAKGLRESGNTVREGRGRQGGALVIETPIANLSRIEKDRIIVPSFRRMEEFTHVTGHGYAGAVEYFPWLQEEPVPTMEVRGITVKRNYWITDTNNEGKAQVPPKIGLEASLIAWVTFYAARGECVVAVGHEDVLAELNVDGLQKLAWFDNTKVFDQPVGLAVFVTAPGIRFTEREARVWRWTPTEGVIYDRPSDPQEREAYEDHRKTAFEAAIIATSPKKVLSLSLPPMEMPAEWVHSYDRPDLEDVIQHPVMVKYAKSIVEMHLKGEGSQRIAKALLRIDLDQMGEGTDERTFNALRKQIQRFLDRLGRVSTNVKSR